MNTFNLNLDLDKRFDNAPVRMRQGDKSGTTIRAAIYDHGELLSGNFTVRYVQAIVGHDHRYYRETGVLANGIATVTVDETYAAAVAGSTFGYFQILQGSAVIASTQSFAVHVLPDATYQAEVGEKYDSAIEDALAELDEATGRISQMVIDATAEYLEAHPEITTTVQDNSLTDAKLIQHGGILDRVARLWHRLDNLLTATPAEADALTVTDAAKTPLAGLALYGRSTQDGTPTPSAPVAIQSVTPNLYQQTVYAAGTSRDDHGLHITYNADGTCTCTGTATASVWLWGGESSANDGFFVTLPAGTYTACGSHSVAVQKKVGSTVSTVGSGSGSYTFALAEETLIKAVPTVPNGTTATDMTVWVALYAGTSAHRYVPYGCAGLMAVGRNLVRSDGDGWRLGGYNADTGEESTISTRMTLTKAAWFPVLPSTRYAISLSSDYKVMVYRYGAGGSFLGHSSFITGSTTFVTDATCAWCSLLVGRTDNANMASEVPSSFGLQIEVGSAATAYQPYAESTTPIDLQGHTLRSLPDGTRDEVTVDAYGHAVLTQRVGVLNVLASDWGASSAGRYRHYVDEADVGLGIGHYTDMYCTTYQPTANTSSAAPANTIRFAADGLSLWLAAGSTLVDSEVTYILAEPRTIDLGAVQLADMPGPDLTAYMVAGLTPDMELTYERDVNLVIAALEAQMAEIATS